MSVIGEPFQTKNEGNKGDINTSFSPLLQGSKVQTRVGLLILLCTWLSNCPIAVTHFLHNSANVPFVSFKSVLLSLFSQL